MHNLLKIVRPMIGVVILGTGWVCFAEVQEPAKTPAAAGSKKAAEPQKATAVPAAPVAKGSTVSPAPSKEGDAQKSGAAEAGSDNGENADERAIRKSAETFAAAYNAHDAKAIAQLFARQAEVTDEAGFVLKGREAIEQDFAQTFADFPESKVEIEVRSVRFLTPNIAVEEGIVRGQPIPNDAENVSGYIAVQVKVDGQWVIASVSDFEIPVEITAHDHLQELAWLVGDWIEESPDAALKTSCRWDHTGNFLIQDYALHAPGGAYAAGSMRMGWDPLRKQIRSWNFNADGGHSEGFWTRDGDSWIVKSTGVNAKGETISGTTVYRLIDFDTMTWRAYDRIVGGIHRDPLPEFIVKRHAPEPGT